MIRKVNDKILTDIAVKSKFISVKNDANGVIFGTVLTVTDYAVNSAIADDTENN